MNGMRTEGLSCVREIAMLCEAAMLRAAFVCRQIGPDDLVRTVFLYSQWAQNKIFPLFLDMRHVTITKL